MKNEICCPNCGYILQRAKPKLGLTAQQASCLEVIRIYLEAEGISPSYDDITEALQLKSKAGAHRLVAILEARGHINRLPGRSRSISLVEGSE